MATMATMAPLATLLYPITGIYNIGTLAFTFHKTAPTGGLETKPTLAATIETKPVAPRRNNYQTLPIVYSHRASNDIRATELPLNTIIMLPHYSLQTVYCRFIYLFTRRKRKR